MHSAVCPSCGTRVELDFLPVAGQVWCPKCQKLFAPPAVPEPGNSADPTDSEKDGKP